MPYSPLSKELLHAGVTHIGDVNILYGNATQFTRNHATGDARVQYGHHIEGEDYNHAIGHLFTNT